MTWSALLLCQNKLARLWKRPHWVGVSCIILQYCGLPYTYKELVAPFIKKYLFYSTELFSNLYKVVNLCLCFCLPPSASLGRLGRSSRVVRCQSYAGKLDWRLHRLLLWFQTQGEFQLPFPCLLFIHSSFLLSSNLSAFFHQVFPRCNPQPLFFISLSPSTDCFLYFGFLCLFIYFN